MCTRKTRDSEWDIYKIDTDYTLLPWRKIERFKRCKTAQKIKLRNNYITKNDFQNQFQHSSVLECYDSVIEHLKYTNQDETKAYFEFGRWNSFQKGICYFVKSSAANIQNGVQSGSQNKHCPEGYSDKDYDKNFDFYEIKAERPKIERPGDICSLKTAQELLDMGYTAEDVEYEREEDGKVKFEIISQHPIS